MSTVSMRLGWLKVTGGSHGRWEVEYKKETLPVVHLGCFLKHGWDRGGIGHYEEKAKVRSGPSSAEVVEASVRWKKHIDLIIEKRKVVVQEHEEDKRGTLHRVGYVGVFEIVGEVEFDGMVLRFKIGKPI